jgi:hypothetical protein
MFVFADAQLAHGHGKRFRARQHVRQGSGVIGEGFDIKKYRARHVPGAVFTVISRCVLARGAIRASII